MVEWYLSDDEERIRNELRFCYPCLAKEHEKAYNLSHDTLHATVLNNTCNCKCHYDPAWEGIK